jgi:hypothetical protein
VTISRVANTKGLPPLVSGGDAEVGVDCPLLLLPDGTEAVAVVVADLWAIDGQQQGGSSSPSPIPTPKTKDEMAW